MESQITEPKLATGTSSAVTAEVQTPVQAQQSSSLTNLFFFISAFFIVGALFFAGFIYLHLQSRSDLSSTYSIYLATRSIAMLCNGVICAVLSLTFAVFAYASKK